jgi:hypothetical protein
MLFLERNGRDSRLTDASGIIYKRATSNRTESEDLVIELSELCGLNRGKLRLGLPLMEASRLQSHSRSLESTVLTAQARI